MIRSSLAALAVVISVPLGAHSAAGLPVRLAATPAAATAMAEPVFGRIPYGDSYRYASPYYSYGYPRLYYYPWGLQPRYRWHYRRSRSH